MSKITFLTFSNTDFMNCDRILLQAKEFEEFDYILHKTEKDIPEFIEKHRNFINQYKQGYGLWIWKPKIILDTLLDMKDDDILVYMDAGIFINKNGRERFRYYLSTLKDDKYICVFSANNRYIAQQSVKTDAVMEYYPQFNNEWNTSCYAGLMIIRKNEKSIQLIKDWLGLCEQYNFLDRSRSQKYKDLHDCGNDCDNGLFNLCLSKYKHIVSKIYPDEVNIYYGDWQAIHTNHNYADVDWSPLNNIPFQVRRLTPGRPNYS
jgi:hypothetical protein